MPGVRPLIHANWSGLMSEGCCLSAETRAPRGRLSSQRNRLAGPSRRLFESLEPRLLLSADVLTYHNDNADTGENLNETTLNPTNVNVSTFGKLFSVATDGQAYAQPLVKTGVTIATGAAQGVHDVVFIATEHDSLYAFDAHDGTLLWHRSFIAPDQGVTTVPASDVNALLQPGEPPAIAPEIGITSTPVVDPATNTLYLMAVTKEIVGGNTHYVQRIHAVNIADGSAALGGPAVIADTILNDSGSLNFQFVSGPTLASTGAPDRDPATGLVHFNAVREFQRSALTLSNGVVYIAYASYGDINIYHGWILGYRASDLALAAVFSDTPNGESGGIWESAGGLSVDAQGNLYVNTGNGTFDVQTDASGNALYDGSGKPLGLDANGFPINGDYGDAILKLTPDSSTADHPGINGWGLSVTDYFVPGDFYNRQLNDYDLGSSGVVLLPDAVGATQQNNQPQQLVLAGDKTGMLFLLDRNNLGGFETGPNHTDGIVQETSAVLGGTYSDPAYYNGGLYIVGGYYQTHGQILDIANSAFSFSATPPSPDSYSYPGSTPAVSAHGSDTSSAIVWDVATGPGELRAYSAASYGTELYSSGWAANNRDQLGTAIKFSVPTVANGQVFVATSNALVVYGLNPPAGGTPSLIANGGFEFPIGAPTLNRWKVTGNVSVDASGNNGYSSIASLQISGAGSISQVINGLTPNTTYRLSAEAKTAGDPVYLSVSHDGQADGNYIEASGFDFNSGSIIFTTGPSATLISIATSVSITIGKDGQGTAYVDAVMLSPLSSAANLGFESGTLTNWGSFLNSQVLIDATPANVDAGKYAAEIVGGGGITQTLTGLQPLTTYQISVWGKTTGDWVAMELTHDGQTNSSYFGTSTAYSQGTITFTTGANTTSATLALDKGVQGDGWVDQISIEPLATAADLGFENGIPIGNMPVAGNPWSQPDNSTIIDNTGFNSLAGSIAAEIRGAGGFSQWIPNLFPLTTYQVTARSKSTGDWVAMGVTHDGSQSESIYIGDSTNTYEEGTLIFTTGADTSGIFLSFVKGALGNAWVDQVSIQALQDAANLGFESGTPAAAPSPGNPWVAVGSSIMLDSSGLNAMTGSKAAIMQGACGLYQWIGGLLPLTTYQITAWCKSTGDWVTMGVSDGTTGSNVYVGDSTDTYAQGTVTFTTGGDTTGVFLSFVKDALGTAWVDQISMTCLTQL
jgi:hypothetical protein